MLIIIGQKIEFPSFSFKNFSTCRILIYLNVSVFNPDKWNKRVNIKSGRYLISEITCKYNFEATHKKSVRLPHYNFTLLIRIIKSQRHKIKKVRYIAIKSIRCSHTIFVTSLCIPREDENIHVIFHVRHETRVEQWYLSLHIIYKL